MPSGAYDSAAFCITAAPRVADTPSRRTRTSSASGGAPSGTATAAGTASVHFGNVPDLDRLGGRLRGRAQDDDRGGADRQVRKALAH